MTDVPSSPDGNAHSDDTDLWWPPAPETIRLMGDHTVQIPLWGEVGLLYAGAEALMFDLGVSHQLASDLAGWGNAWQTCSAQPEHDAEAAALIRRLRNETGNRYAFVYQP